METHRLFADFTLFHFDIYLFIYIYLFILSKTTIIDILSVAWLQMKQKHSVKVVGFLFTLKNY